MHIHMQKIRSINAELTKNKCSKVENYDLFYIFIYFISIMKESFVKQYKILSKG